MKPVRLFALAFAALLGAGAADAQIAFRAASQAATASGATPAFVASATNTVNSGSMAINRPAGAAQNDVLIAQVTVKGVQTITAPAPAGSWTLVNSISTSTAGGQITQAVYWRRVGVIGSEPASYTWSWSVSDRATGGIAAYRNVEALLNPIDVSGVATTNATTTITLPTIVTTTPNTMLVALLGSSRATNTHGVPTGMTIERYEVSSGAGPNGTTSSLDEQVQAAAGSTGAKTATTSGFAADNIAHLLALRASGPLAIAVPAGTVAGDVMIASIAVRPCSAASGAACTVTIGAPAGWTLVNTVNQTTGGAFGDRVFVYWRVATAGDVGASYTWTFAGAPTHTGAAGGILSFSGVDTTSPIVIDGGQATPSASAHAAPSINTGTVTNTMLVSTHSVNASGTWTAQVGMTERVDIASLAVPNAAGISLEMNMEARAAAGATGTRTGTLSNPPAINTGATHMLALRPVLAHYAISVLSTSVANCDFAEVTVTAHDSAHAAVNPPATRIVTLSTSVGTGVWQPTLVAGAGVWTPSGLNNGAATYQWAGGESSFTVRLRQSAVTSLSVNLSDSFVVEDPTEDPAISFTNSALRISNGANAALTIGNQIALKPSNTGAGSQSLFLQAIRTDTVTGACASLFPSGSEVDIEVGAQCNNPAVCTGNVILTTTSGSGSPTGTFVPNGAFPSTIRFRFTTGNAEAPFLFSYADAGQITLQFRRLLPAPPAGVYVSGSSSAFVTRPFGFAFRGASAAASIQHGTLPTSALLAAAGDNFTMTVAAYGWAAAEDDGTGNPLPGANIADNGATPNFASATTVSATGNLPGVVTGVVSRGAACAGAATIAAGSWSGGAATIGDWCYSEAGNAFFGAAAADYIVAGVNVSGNSGLDGTGAAGGYVGRFSPKRFRLTGTPAFTPRFVAGCAPASIFAYMDEEIRLDGFRIEAINTLGNKTRNYDGTYALHVPGSGAGAKAAFSVGARSGTTDYTARISAAYTTAPVWSQGLLERPGANPIEINMMFDRNATNTPDGPLAATAFGVAPTDSDGVRLPTYDLDVNNDATADHLLAGSTELRFGRLFMQNAYGPSIADLPVPIEVQYWNGTNFARNNDDSCTTLLRSDFSLGFTSPVPPPPNLTACETAVLEGTVAFASGRGTLNMAKPGISNSGSVLLTANLDSAGGNYCPAVGVADAPATNADKAYLLGRWDGGTAHDDKPSARAAFGLYGSQPKNFIFFRENY